MSATFVKEIRYNAADKDYAYLLNGEIAGYAATRWLAEQALNELVFNLLARENVSAADLTPEDAEAVLVSQQAPAVHDYRLWIKRTPQRKNAEFFIRDGIDAQQAFAALREELFIPRAVLVRFEQMATVACTACGGENNCPECDPDDPCGCGDNDCPECTPATAPATEAHTITPEINPANGRYEFAVRIGAMHCGYAGSNLDGELLAAEIKAARSAA